MIQTGRWERLLAQDRTSLVTSNQQWDFFSAARKIKKEKDD